MSYLLIAVLSVLLLLSSVSVLVVRNSLAGGEDQGVVWYESAFVGRLYVGDAFVGFVSRNAQMEWVDKSGRQVQKESLYRDEQAKVWRFRLDQQPFVSVK